MATVIEHRDIDGVLSAYNFYALPKFAIYQGNEPCVVYEGADMNEGADKMEEWLGFIKDSGTAAVYKLRVYDTDQSITNKTAYKAATRFQLNGRMNDRYETTPDGKTIILREGDRAVGNTSAQNSQIQQLIDNQNKMIALLMNQGKTEEAQRWDKVIGLLSQGEKEKEPDNIDKLIKLGEMLIDKPEIIDRIGYVIRPSAYQVVQQQVNGTEAKELKKEVKTENKMNQENTGAAAEQETDELEPLTPEEEKLYESIDNSVDALEDKLGLEALDEALRKLAGYSEEKLKSAIKWL